MPGERNKQSRATASGDIVSEFAIQALQIQFTASPASSAASIAGMKAGERPDKLRSGGLAPEQ